MNISRAEDIYGWMEPDELSWLAAQARNRRNIVEIGSFCGRSTAAIVDNTVGVVHAVDTWKGSKEHERLLAGNPPDALYNEFRVNFEKAIATKKLIVHKMLSSDAAKVLADEGERFDMIFIDASHDYESVKEDILSWRPLVTDDGILCGHDFGRYSGVNRAVRELLSGFRLMQEGTIWYVGHSVIERSRSDRTVSRKVFYTLNINMEYAPEICKITYPFLRLFAEKCSADFHIITDRQFPDMPITFEKLQIYELGKNNDWNIYFDSDALVHPDTFDPTNHMSKDTVLHNGMDMAGNRFKYDRYFQRDRRHIGSGNWFTVASDWCIDLWKPPDDLTLEDMLQNIYPTAGERNAGITPDHLIDDYILSRNIAKYGLKFQSYLDLMRQLNRHEDEYFWHQYTVPIPEKVKLMKEVLTRWKLEITE